MMSFRDKLLQALREKRIEGVADSPLQNYVHEVSRPFHLRRNSALIWSKFDEEKQAKLLDFHAMYR